MIVHISIAIYGVLACLSVKGIYYNWALLRENLSLGVCKQHRRRPAWASAQSDQRLLLFAFWKVSYVHLLQVKFQFSGWSM